MIHVEEQDPPSDFGLKVADKGAKFLKALGRTPTRKEWASHSYWRAVIPSLHRAYGGICAYACHWIPLDTGSPTVEHFVAKSVDPNQAYKWENYRLVCGTMNGRKGDRPGVLDPFTIENGWFVLDFPSLLVRPAASLQDPLRSEVCETIRRLRLNDESTCILARERFVRDYCLRYVPFDYVKREAPFIARELDRQGLVEGIVDVMGYPPPTGP